jgi:aryl-alcohol dehydrogenase-like predicted oxidoreductase
VEADVLPTLQRYDMGVLSWGPLASGWLSGKYRKDAPIPTSRRSERLPQRFDMSLPGNQLKLDAVEQLARLADEAGMPLIHLALGFVLQHPAITSAIIGPRTMDHLDSHLGAADVTLSPEILDRIDEIVPPGVTVSFIDRGYQPPALTDKSQRRRRS